MNRQQVRTLVKSAANNLNAEFNSGRVSEFNSEANKKYPYIWLESVKADTRLSPIQLPVDTWKCVIHVVKLDSAGSLPEQYEDIVDECDTIARKLIRLINQEISGYKLITLSSISREPSIHKLADNTTGVILSFDLNAPDTEDIC